MNRREKTSPIYEAGSSSRLEAIIEKLKNLRRNSMLKRKAKAFVVLSHPLFNDFLQDVLFTAYSAANGIDRWAKDLSLSPKNRLTFREIANDTEHEITTERITNAIKKILYEDVNIDDELFGWIRTAVIEGDSTLFNAQCADAIVQIASFNKIIYPS